MIDTNAPAVPATTESPNTEAETLCGEFSGPEEYGLALSGGGIRATLFHYGALLRINELGHLREIDRIAGVSGGAIAAGLLARVWDDLEWKDGRAINLRNKLEPLVMRLAGLPLDIPIVVIGIIPFVSPAKLLARVLDIFVFRGLRLRDLPPVPGKRPRFVFNASDLATATLFRFSEPYMGTYKVGLLCNPDVKVATAVAASAAFPPFVSPMNVDMNPERVIDPGGAKLHGDIRLRRRAALVDGGAYDNLALEPITGRCRKYLVSDAGGNISLEPPSWKWWFWSLQILRTLDIAVSQSRALRRSALFLTRDTHPYALWRTITDPTNKGVASPFKVHPGWPRYLSTRSTRLWPFSREDRRWLINWGYLTSDVMLRRWMWDDAPVPQDLPFGDAQFAMEPPETPPTSEEPD